MEEKAVLQAQLVLWQSERFGTHTQNRKHFLVSHYLSIDVWKLLGISESSALIQLTEVFMDGNQHILDVFNISKILFDHGQSLAETTLKTIRPSAACGLPFGMNCNFWMAAFNLRSASKLSPRLTGVTEIT